MELLAIVLLLIILFTLFSFKSSVNERLTSLQEDLKELRKIAQKNVTSQAAADISEKHPGEEPTAKKDTWQSGFKVMKNVSPSNSPAIPQPEKPAPQKPKEPEVRVISAGSTSSKAKAPSFFERHPEQIAQIADHSLGRFRVFVDQLGNGS